MQTVGGIVDMLITMGLWTLFLIAYALLVIALLFALFTRAFYLWLIAIFSPLFGLFYYLEGKGKFAESLTKKGFSFGSFISLALVPVYVSAALGFGLMFIKMAADVEIKPENSTFFAEGTATQDKPGAATFRIGSKDENKSMTIKMEGVPMGMQESTGTAKAAGAAAVKLGATAIGKIVVSFLSVAILWMAVMAALGSSEITGKAIEPIASFGNNMGKLALDMPKYMPIPIGGGHKMSMAGLSSASNTITQNFSNKSAEMGSEF